ncbi:electron transfer flavoprotein subunit beta/FixA family protein [Arthrobacter castelli]|uniref:electron transfer flavoprotein subunit beta/FixA family protein n=1 Tax=Arthrobacter castelli TaxID=271431 RepID=UPI0003F8442B|nr:electron transfer flavoprotein subunit alpha [Arthrobacter castelli]
MTNVLICIKRVPEISGEILLSDDQYSIDARHVGYTLSAHDECAIELGVGLAKDTGGHARVLSIGAAGAAEQLRYAVAVGADSATLIEADPEAFGPADVAAAIASEVRQAQMSFELILVGNDAADTGDFQVGVRLAYQLDRPVLTGINTAEIRDATVLARGAGPQGVDVFEIPLPALIAVQEGGVEPRYPSIRGRMKAKRLKIEQKAAPLEPAGSGRVRLTLPEPKPSTVHMLGEGPDAAPALVDVLARSGVLNR